MSNDFLTMTENGLVSEKTPISGYNYPDMGQTYDPNKYTSITKTSIINKENPSGIPLASEKRFGLVTAGEGLKILRDGFIALNVGYGFSIDPSSKKLILSAEIYPYAGNNIEVESNESGRFTVSVVGEDEVEPLSNLVPTSSAIASYVESKTGMIQTINSSILDNGPTLTNAINSLYEKSHYVHTQITPNETWVINHPLYKMPSVTITTEDNMVVVGDIEYISLGQVIVRFTARFSGSAFLN